jgi:hypothetical protein
MIPVSLTQFLDFLIKYGLEHFGKYYGVYRGVVVDNKDPEQRGRVQAHVRGMQGTPPDVWIDPAFTGAGEGRGMFWPPEVGDGVRVSFDRGDPGKPVIYWGGWFGTEDDDLPTGGLGFGYDGPAPAGKPTKRGFKTRAGHLLSFEDKADEEAVRLAWHKPDPGELDDPEVSANSDGGLNAFIDIDKNGSVSLANSKGARCILDAEKGNNVLLDEHGNSISSDKDGIKLIDKDGNFITLAKGDITLSTSGNLNITCKSVNLKTGGTFLVDNATDQAVLGTKLIAYLASHTHPHPMGPTSPPTVPPTPSLLSKNVKLK